MKKSYRFIITPTNEGQPLNYSEVVATSKVTRERAQEIVNRRENEITAGLMKLLPRGTWDCEIEEV